MQTATEQLIDYKNKVEKAMKAIQMLNEMKLGVVVDWYENWGFCRSYLFSSYRAADAIHIIRCYYKVAEIVGALVEYKENSCIVMHFTKMFNDDSYNERWECGLEKDKAITLSNISNDAIYDVQNQLIEEYRRFEDFEHDCFLDHDKIEAEMNFRAIKGAIYIPATKFMKLDQAKRVEAFLRDNHFDYLVSSNGKLFSRTPMYRMLLVHWLDDVTELPEYISTTTPIKHRKGQSK